MKRYCSAITFSSAHCDDTGLVHTETYALLLNRLVEDWFGNALDHPFTKLHRQPGAAIPTVEIDLQVEQPGVLGQRIDLGLAVSRLGSRSLTLRIDGARCFHADVVLVWVENDGDGLRSAAIPDALRRRMAAYRVDAHDEALNRDTADD